MENHSYCITVVRNRFGNNNYVFGALRIFKGIGSGTIKTTEDFK